MFFVDLSIVVTRVTSTETTRIQRLTTRTWYTTQWSSSNLASCYKGAISLTIHWLFSHKYGSISHDLIGWLVGWLVEFYMLATSTVISGRVPTYDIGHSWWHYSAAPLGNQATSTMNWYRIQSHYPNTELTSPYLILLMPSARLRSDKYRFDKSLVWFDWEPNLWSPTCEAPAQPIRHVSQRHMLL